MPPNGGHSWGRVLQFPVTYSQTTEKSASQSQKLSGFRVALGVDPMLGILAVVGLLFGFTATSVAATAVAPDGDLLGLLKPIYDAVMSGNKWAAAALALVAVVALLRKYVAPRWAFLMGDAGGSLLALLASFGGASATALLAGAGMSWALLWMSVKVALTAAGGYTLIKRLIVGPLMPLINKLPAWARIPLQAALWMFGNPNAIKEAEAAGAAAVAANPSAGTNGITGTPTDVA